MQTPIEGHVYRDTHTDERLICTYSPDTWGEPTRRAESMPIEFETVADGDYRSTIVDNYQNGYSKIADSVDEL